MLSKHFGLFKKRAVVLRQMDRIVMTNSMKVPHLTTAESHLLAAMSLISYSSDPLTERMVDLRLSMSKGRRIDEGIIKTFIK